MTKPATPAAVAHRVHRVAEAVEALLTALDTGAPLDVDQARTLRNAARLAERRAVGALVVAETTAVEGCEQCEAVGAECTADRLGVTA
jgi:hypothetical protein